MDQQIGFTFRNIHSSEFGIWVKSDDRTLLPEMRKEEYEISGRHGTVDFNKHPTYAKRIINMRLGSVSNETWEELRKDLRKLAGWLSGKGLLIFDDEPLVGYRAAVYSAVSLEQLHLLPVGAFQIPFEAQPLAEDIYYNQVFQPEITSRLESTEVNVNGTTDTCCLITIKNIGNTPIKDIIITRKAAI